VDRCVQGTESHLGNKTEGPLGPDQQVLDNVDGVLKIDQGIDTVTGGIFNLIFTFDARHGFLVTAKSPGKRYDPLNHFFALVEKGLAAVVIPGIENGTVGKNNAHAGDGSHAVSIHPAGHAAGVVGYDAADFGRIDRGRIRPQFFAVGRQIRVRISTQNAGPQGNFTAIGTDAAIPPALNSQQHQHGFGDRLAGQARSGRTKGNRQFQFMAGF